MLYLPNLRNLRHLRFFLLIFCSVTLHAHAKVKVGPLFASHMVLQREMNTPVWGTAEPGEAVVIQFADQSKSVTADERGEWMVRLDPMEASSQPRTLQISGGGNTLRFDDVLVGDVWLCAGQSNMALQLKKTLGGEAEIAAADYPMLRLFGGGHFAATRQPQRELHGAGGWRVCQPDTMAKGAGPSAVAYYFGRDLRQALSVPIGLVITSLGGSMAEAWMSEQAQAGDEQLRRYVEAWAWVDANVQLPPGADPKNAEHYLDAQGQPIARKDYAARFQAWRHAVTRARQRGETIPTDFPEEFARFRPNMAPRPGSMDRPGVAFNSLLHPLIPIGLKGVVWYQGETNADMRDARAYGHLLQSLVGEWRSRWSRDDLPFVVIQLPNFRKPVDQPVQGVWPILREQQQIIAAADDHAHLVVTIETAAVDEPDHWHPRNKKPIGQRAALAALEHVYGRAVDGAGPRFASVTFDGERAVLSFEDSSRGLAAGEVLDPTIQASASAGSQLRGFAIAGEDRVWHFADAAIEGGHVIVWSPEVLNPVAVRYGWSDFPQCNLYSASGLPAGPFRTDDWPLEMP